MERSPVPFQAFEVPIVICLANHEEVTAVSLTACVDRGEGDTTSRQMHCTGPLNAFGRWVGWCIASGGIHFGLPAEDRSLYALPMH